MALSTGQINDAYQQALGRMPTGSELASASSRGDLEGSSGQQQLISELGGGGGDGGGGGGNDYVSSLIETLTGQVIPQAIEFDADAARRAAEQEWGPYYDEILEGYLAKVATASEREIADLATYLENSGIRGLRTEEDLANALSILESRKDEYMGDIERESPLIQEAIGGRAADRGLYFSGGREESQRLQLEKEGRQKGTYERESEYKTSQAKLGAERTEEDIDRQEEARQLEHKRYLDDLERDKKERERDLARSREEAVTGQVETQRQEKYLGWS